MIKRASSFHPEPEPTGSGRLWERLGFRDDPYYVDPLPVDAEALDLFVGRGADRARLHAFVADAPTGKTMVQGPPGVGKTSLVNVVQQELHAAARRFALKNVVEVPADQTREAFLLTVLSGLVASLAAVYRDEDLRHDDAYLRAREAVAQTLRTATDLTLTATLPGGGGGGVGRARTPVSTAPLAVTTPALQELLLGLVRSIERRGFEGVMVPVNNLDAVGETAAIAFLHIVRDVTGAAAAPGVHWLFIGGDGLFQALEKDRYHRRVSESFTNNPVVLAPLGWDDVAMALEQRRRHFALDPDTQLPIEQSVAALVYEAGGGELRFTMARLSRTVREFAARFPSEQVVPNAMALALLSEWGRTQLAAEQLTKQEKDVIEHVRARGGIRAREYLGLGHRNPQRLSQVLGHLATQGYLKSPTRRGMPYTFTAAARFAYAAT